MADLTTALPAKNHNNPPSDAEWLEESLTLKHVHIIRQAEEHASLADKIPDHFTEEAEASYITDFIRLASNCKKELERRRKEEKDPFLRQERQVDSFFNTLAGNIDKALVKANSALTDWLKRKAEAERKAREDDAKLLRERQQAALESANPNVTESIRDAVRATQQVNIAESLAAAPITTMASSTGDLGASSLKGQWEGKITDIDQLDLNKLRPYIAHAELEKALARYVRQGGRKCDGTEIKEVILAKVK